MLLPNAGALMGNAIATLPMYDWPELRSETDRLWAMLRDAIRNKGLDAPERLDRTISEGEEWTRPDLLLSQTCGMPYRLGLHEQVQLVGTPNYGLPDCPQGHYFSVLVAHAEDSRNTLAVFRGATFAFNGPHSESGYASLMRTVAPLRQGTDFFSEGLKTGGHRASILAVADGEADLAAIDVVSWRLAERFVPEFQKLRVVGKTEPTPGLPLITAQGHDAELLAEAVTEGIASLDNAVRAILGVTGLVRIPKPDYLMVT